MRRLLSKLRTTAWYLARPGLHGRFLGDLQARVLRRNGPAARAEAERWCAERAVDTAEALLRITGTAPGASVRERFPERFAHGERAAAQCPVQMGGAGDLDVLYAAAEQTRATRVVETGVAFGWSSLALLLSLANRPGSRLVSTDWHPPAWSCPEFVGCVVGDDLRPLWRLIPQGDILALPQALAGFDSLDLCHYDSDKSHDGRMWAYRRLWRALRPGGCFISDDVSDNLAFRDFCRRVGGDPIVVRNPGGKREFKYVGVLRKEA